MSFLLYAASTPNGNPISAFLEELKIVYPGISYEYVTVGVSKHHSDNVVPSVEHIEIWKTRHKVRSSPLFLLVTDVHLLHTASVNRNRGTWS